MADRRRNFELAVQPSSPIALAGIVSVTNPDASHYVVRFNRSVTLNTGVVADTNFAIDGVTLGDVEINDASSAIIEADTVVETGTDWLLTAQPNWLVTAAGIPEGGVTS